MRYFLVDKTVFDNNKVGMYGKLIYAILCKFLNADGTCFPSRKTISKCGNFSISTYNKYVSVMLLENVLEKKIRVRKNGSQTSNLFKLKKNKENSYKWQMKLEKCKGEFASKLLYKVVNEELEERIPRLPKYISDGLDWIEKKLGGR